MCYAASVDITQQNNGVKNNKKNKQTTATCQWLRRLTKHSQSHPSSPGPIRSSQTATRVQTFDW